VRLGATLAASLIVVLARPASWPLALLGFLVRGGWLVIVAPIVVLPTAVGLGNVVAPWLEDVAFGRSTAGWLTVAAISGVIAIGWLVGGGLIAAWAEIETIRVVSDRAGSTGRGRWGLASRVLAARLVAHLPLVVAATFGLARLVSVAYRELTLPSQTSVPAVVRVLVGAPDAVIAIVVAWLFGETVGALATRRIVVSGAGVRAALGQSLTGGRVLGRSLALAAVTTLVLLAVLIATGLATASAWDALASELALGSEPLLIGLLSVVFVGLFAGALVLIGVTVAWRCAVWTTDPNGTFGVHPGDRSGDW
jgi:hypothetical protein